MPKPPEHPEHPFGEDSPRGCGDDECSCGECTDPDGIVEQPVDWAVISRRYEMALADYRLDRGHVLWPAVAAAVDASLSICDPVGLLAGNTNPCAWRAYERIAVRLWSELWMVMLDTIGEREGMLSLHQQQVHEAVWSVLDEELGEPASVSDSNADDRRFAEIIENAFGATPGTHIAPVNRNDVSAVRRDRVELMVQLLAERLADFPWGSDEPF